MYVKTHALKQELKMSVDQLNSKVREQSGQISQLQERVSSLVDEIHSLRNDFVIMQSMVKQDVEALVKLATK
tara:strand:- start:104 stop:319 length:216 start_codon:yes stop_codon:yes gene_type:complete